MKLLLDTHVVLWFATDDRRLSRAAKRLLEEDGHDLFFSAVSAAEISIKWTSGRLDLDAPPRFYVRQIIQEMGLRTLFFGVEHALGLAELPAHHSDPFDRMLVAQAIQDDLAIVTVDKDIRKYDVKIVW